MSKLDLSEAIKGRRSIRKFKKQKIPDENITKLIEAASYAPSAGNIQPWHFIVAKDSTVRKKLAEAAYHQSHMEEAPAIIVVCADEKKSSLGYGHRGKTLYCLQDTAAATQNILLTACAMGLGTCWTGSFNEDEVREMVHAPVGVRPVVMISVGYPDVIPRQRNRKLLSDILHFDRF